MDETERKSAALFVLFQTYPSFQAGEASEIAERDRMASAQVYMMAVEQYAAVDVEAAVKAFLAGEVVGHNTAFPPTAPQVGGAARRAMEKRLDAEARYRALHPRLPPPDVPKTDASRARVAAMVDGLVANLAEQQLTEEAAAARRKDARAAAIKTYFEPDMQPDAVAARLGLGEGL